MAQHKNWSEEQIIGILKQVETERTLTGGCRKNGVGESTHYKWNAAQLEPDTAASNSTKRVASNRLKTLWCASD